MDDEADALSRERFKRELAEETNGEIDPAQNPVDDMMADAYLDAFDQAMDQAMDQELKGWPEGCKGLLQDG